MTDLRFISSVDMIKELQDRFDDMIFLGSAQKTQKTEDLTISYSGSYHSCVGLVEIARTALKVGGLEDDAETID
jgi:hypothetical protein